MKRVFLSILDRSEVHAIQAKMRQIRADHLQKYGREVFKASELENWNP
jgi:hypothetical protein